MRRFLLTAASLLLGALVCAQSVGVSVSPQESAATVGAGATPLLGEPSTLLTGLLAYYPLDDTSDVAGGGYTLTNNNGVTFVTGVLGNAASFSAGGVTAYLSQSTTQLGTSSTGSSASCWVRWNASNASLVVLAGELTTTNQAWRLQMAGSNQRVLGLVRATGLLTANPTPTIADSSWHHVVFTYDPADFKLRVYLDNASPTISSATGTQAQLAYQNLGWDIGGDPGGANGMGLNTVAEVDECGFWDKPLTSTEVGCLNGGGTPPPYPFEGVCEP